MFSDELLKLLAGGEHHAAAALARHFGGSAARLAESLAALESLGIEIEHDPQRGYAIAGGLDLLSAARIREALSATAAQLLEDLILLHTVDSTNAELQRRGAAPDGARVCLAECQTAGRGRRGRHWVSPFAQSIYLSVAWRFEGGVEVLEGLSLAAGVMCCDALAAAGVEGLALKWPNDVQLEQRKVAGILVEMTGDAAGPSTAIIGIGINIALADAAAAVIEQPWADLRGFPMRSRHPRSALVAAVLNELLPALARYAHEGFAPWQARWNALDAYAQREVTIENGTQRQRGTACGVNARGMLQLRAVDGMHSIHGGELSLRPA